MTMDEAFLAAGTRTGLLMCCSPWINTHTILPTGNVQCGSCCAKMVSLDQYRGCVLCYFLVGNNGIFTTTYVLLYLFFLSTKRMHL